MLNGTHVYKQTPADTALSSMVLNKTHQFPKKFPAEAELVNKIKVFQTECCNLAHQLACARTKTRITIVLYSCEYEVVEVASSEKGKVVKAEHNFRLKCWYM